MMVLVLRARIPKGTKPLWVKGEGYPSSLCPKTGDPWKIEREEREADQGRGPGRGREGGDAGKRRECAGEEKDERFFFPSVGSSTLFFC
jgi:hypothetical protein